MSRELDTATLAAGCFWCYQPIFSALEGVEEVIPGYSGGESQTATYAQTSTGDTEHAESFQIKFDPAKISFKELLEVFWHVHNPTTLNKQGYDVGPEYRSAIFYHNQTQKQIAETSKHELDESGEFSDPIVTEISEFKGFYPAEDYHQDYYNKNKWSPYSKLVIQPKINKFKKLFKDRIREEYI